MVSLDERGAVMYGNGYICANGFGLNEANTLCRDMGYSGASIFESPYDIPPGAYFSIQR